ncbi:MAG TPA: Rrf2 family transcriptional regulator [Syntrophorhabdaceae bacterium]|nr:Rrf2 family transcriptional regulator [Syntrophorhabdaceae bacterium]HOL04698.1 Rrf2 family transcriptional regulator [Syntrophorhabdaceae bacterium]HPC66132.1 Rrf2 family transcriptional regulator [Syntrophorhabdaceae bacterium]HPP41126.1 Rrf2 family transcriptional regulator [Syntrophorhabdaceae bacterium]HQE80696.1 Rrf2 family transcriptional regulator [Syntrophorhabdaceae bacterium]
MKISTKGRYGLRSMIDLAINSSGNTPVFISDIAKRQHLSEKYLEHIFGALHKAGLVRSIRGRKGGYLLQKNPEEITLSEIITALEGKISLVECVLDPDICPSAKKCVTRDLWQGLSDKINEYLSSHTLNDLIQMQKSREQNDTLMYYI